MTLVLMDSDTGQLLFPWALPQETNNSQGPVVTDLDEPRGSPVYPVDPANPWGLRVVPL